jgi:acetyl-CoA/propionyl-CoA carboxylase biotin carboxyl carrier protein
VRAGDLDTDLLERALPDLGPGEVPAQVYAAFTDERLTRLTGTDPWEALPGWRPSRPAEVSWDVLDPDGHRLRVTRCGSTLRVGDTEHDLRTSSTQSLVAVDGDTTWVALRGLGTWSVTLAPELRVKGGDAAADAEVRSPMPGAVIAVHAATGDVVEAGAPLVTVEAMKMEHVLKAPTAGTAHLLVRTGDQVVVQQPLARVEP